MTLLHSLYRVEAHDQPAHLVLGDDAQRFSAFRRAGNAARPRGQRASVPSHWSGPVIGAGLLFVHRNTMPEAAQ